MSDFPLDDERPDWPQEFDDPVSRLGPPLAVHHTSRRKALAKGLSGLAMFLGGLVANYYYFVVWQMPVIPEKFLLLLLFGPPTMGCYLVYSAWRDQGLWTLAYPTGLLRWQRGEIVSFPWEEIDRLHLHRVTKVDGVQGAGDAAGYPVTAWLPLHGAGSRFLGSQVELVRKDGVAGTFPSSLDGYDELSRRAQEETFRALWPGVWERYRAGDLVAFNDLTLSWGGLHKGTDILPWSELSEAKVANGKLVVGRHGKWRPFAEVPIAQVPNPHLFLALLAVGRPVVAHADNPADEDADPA